MSTGQRSTDTELESLQRDTFSYFLRWTNPENGLVLGAYFDTDTAQENEIRSLADALYRRVDWPHCRCLAPALTYWFIGWAQSGGATVTHGWKPESGFLEFRWEGDEEALILYLLGLGSPTQSVARRTVWT